MKTTLIPKDDQRQTRFMIADDNLEVFSLVHDICARYEDVKIECYDSPEAARDAFEAEPEAFEFVFTDFEMPDTGSFELTRRLRPLAPVLNILLSTWNELQSNEEAVEKGFCEPARKPFPFVTLQYAFAPAEVEYADSFARVTNDFNLEPAY